MASLDGKKLKQVIDPTLAKAFTHPLRGHVWITVCEKGITSPTEIANELELDVTEVSYHFRKLQKKKLIKLAHTKPRRGFNEHFYEPCAPVLFFDDFDWMGIPEAIRSSLSADMIRQIVEELIGALGEGSFDARSRHLSRTWLMLDERGWKELMRLLLRTLERIHAIQERAAERCKGTSETTIPVALVMAAFETAAGIAQEDVGETEAL
jgi:DNA-binding transcriptional ArsR family regulator